MKLFKQFLLAFFLYLTPMLNAQIAFDMQFESDYEVSYDVLSNSPINFNTGLGQLGVVGTKYNAQNTALTNPARMFAASSSINVSYANLNYELYNNNAITNFGTISGHKVFGKHAIGIFSKQGFEKNYSTHMDTGYPRDTVIRPNTFVTGVAYAYQLSKKISFGMTLSHYYARFQEDDRRLFCTRERGCWAENAENYHGLMVNLGMTYQDKVSLGKKQQLNWSLGASINQIGNKQSAFSHTKDEYFLPTQVFAGASVGYQYNFDNGSSFNTTVLYQSNKLLEAKYSDNDDNGIDDRIENSAIRSIVYAFVDERFEEELEGINHHIGLETIYQTKSGLEFGLRATFERLYLLDRAYLYAGLHFGYSNFYIDFGHRFELAKYSRDVNILGASLGYRID